MPTEPFFTVGKGALRRIIDGIEGTDAAFAAALYVALRWHANDEHAAEGPVAATVAQLARRAGVSYKTAAKALGILRAIGVIGIEGRSVPGTKARAPSIYTFPPIGRTPSGTIGRTLGTEIPPRRAETQKKERKEQKEPYIAPAAAAAPLPSLRSGPEDGCFEALCRLQGFDYRTLPSSGAERGRINKALQTIRASTPDATPAMIDGAAQCWRRKYRDLPCTAPTVASHWSELTAGMTSGGATVDSEVRRRARAEIASLNAEIAAIRALAPSTDAEETAAQEQRIAEIAGKIRRLERNA